MTFLPQGTPLGKLEPIQVYEFYDQSLLFSCRNASGSIFLAVSISEAEDFETWLYVSMSPDRFNCVQSGAIDLHDAFVDAEDGMVFLIQTSYDMKGEVVVKSRPTHELSKEMLPLPGEFLNLKTETLPKLADPLRKAAQTQMEFTVDGPRVQ